MALRPMVRAPPFVRFVIVAILEQLCGLTAWEGRQRDLPTGGDAMNDVGLVTFLGDMLAL